MKCHLCGEPMDTTNSPCGCVERKMQEAKDEVLKAARDVGCGEYVSIFAIIELQNALKNLFKMEARDESPNRG